MTSDSCAWPVQMKLQDMTSD